MPVGLLSGDLANSRNRPYGSHVWVRSAERVEAPAPRAPAAVALRLPDVLLHTSTMIAVDEKLPEATLMETTEFGDACPLSPKPVNTVEAAKGKRIVVFGLPGAYTPTCSAKHVPGYLANLDALKARGIDEIWCVSVNDAYVMAAWGRDQDAIGKIRMLGDGNGELAKKLGLENDSSKSGMGVRSRRYSLLVDDGVVKQVNVEQPGKFEVSNAETILTQLR